MGDFLCPDCGWQGREEKQLPTVPCPVCGQGAMSLDLPDQNPESPSGNGDPGLTRLDELAEDD